VKLSEAQLGAFQEHVWDYYRVHGRHDLPWRTDTSGYSIFISEVMLQQTQVSRVLSKYELFMDEAANFEALADMSLPDVLRLWSGLGYNRRARYLRDAARRIVDQHHGVLPSDFDELCALPGIGPNTAGSIMAFAHNLPVVFIETNIRSVFLHHFYPKTTGISDALLMPLIQQTLYEENSREWYWALMDYGVHLKRTQPNPSRASSHHVKQSQFEGSRRQIRGKILKELSKESMNYEHIVKLINDERTESVLEDLVGEKFITISSDGYVAISD